MSLLQLVELVLASDRRVGVTGGRQDLLLLVQLDLLGLLDLRPAVRSENDDAARLQEPGGGDGDSLDLRRRAEEETLALGGPDVGGDALNVLAPHAGRLEDLTPEVRQRVNGEVAEVGEADEAVFRVVRLGLGLEVGEPHFPDAGSLVSCQFVLPARLQRWQDKQLELLLGGDEHPVREPTKVILVVAANVLNGNAVVVDHLDVDDRGLVLQLDLFGQHCRDLLGVALLGSADGDVQQEDEDLAAVGSGPKRRGDRLR